MEFTLNGDEQVYEGDPKLPLLTYLREQAGLISPKDGCAPQAACGTCTVLGRDKPGLLAQIG